MVEKIKCPECSGKGYKGPDKKHCSKCHGSGKVGKPTPKKRFSHYEDCKKCKGEGKIKISWHKKELKQCPTCKGIGTQPVYIIS